MIVMEAVSVAAGIVACHRRQAKDGCRKSADAVSSPAGCSHGRKISLGATDQHGRTRMKATDEKLFFIRANPC
jgi:hypothetical protein